MYMKTLISIFAIVLSLSLSVPGISQNIAINTTGNAPDVSAMLDIVNSNKGLLLPRVSLSSTTDASTIATPAVSLLVYNTNSSITGTDADGVGFYYNSGTTLSPVWKKLVGQTTRWDDLRITLDRGSDATQIDYLTGTSGPQLWFFRNNSGVESMSFTVQLPHTWKEGTTIYPHLHWTPKTSGSGDIEWNFEYTWVNYDPVTPQVFPATTTSTVVASGPFTATSHMISSLTPGNAGLDATGKKISSVLVCRIWRNSSNENDTYSGNAGLIFLDFHIQVDGYGSTAPYIK